MNTFDLRLDLDKGLAPVQVVRIRQGDHDGTTIRAAVYDHGAALSGTVTACAIVMKLPDGTHYYRKEASWSGGTATVTIDERQAASAVGRTLLAYFTVTVGDAQYSTGAFAVIVEPDAVGDAELPEGYDTAIQDAIDALIEATNSIPERVQAEVDAQLVAHPEWTTTVQDNSLTDAKLVQKGGILQREQWLETMLPNIPRKATAEADVHSVTDSAGGGPLGISVYGRSTQDGTPTPDAPVPIVSVEGNLYQQTVYAAGATHSTAGITVTHNADGTCTCSGTATSPAWLWGGGNSTDSRFYVTLPAGTYTVCGSHSVIAQKMVGSTVSNIVSQTVWQATFTLTETTLVKAVPVIPINTTMNGKTVWVALYRGSTAYPYVPYDNVGLLALGKNLAKNNAKTSTINGVTFTVNADGTIAVRGTATANSQVNLATRGGSDAYLLTDGTYTLTGCPDGGSSGTYELALNTNPSGAVVARDYGSGSTFTLANGKGMQGCGLYIMIRSGQTVGLTFRPMLRRAGTDAGFVPYTESVIPIPLGGHALRSLPDGTRDEVTVDEWGHAILTQRVGETTQAVTEGVSGTVGTDVMSSTGAIANGAQVIYKLATPQTIDLGYLDPALLPAPDLTAYVVPSAPSVLRYGFDVAAALAEIATA